jgi:hypothetical protein
MSINTLKEKKKKVKGDAERIKLEKEDEVLP